MAGRKAVAVWLLVLLAVAQCSEIQNTQAHVRTVAARISTALSEVSDPPPTFPYFWTGWKVERFAVALLICFMEWYMVMAPTGEVFSTFYSYPIAPQNPSEHHIAPGMELQHMGESDSISDLLYRLSDIDAITFAERSKWSAHWDNYLESLGFYSVMKPSYYELRDGFIRDVLMKGVKDCHIIDMILVVMVMFGVVLTTSVALQSKIGVDFDTQAGLLVGSNWWIGGTMIFYLIYLPLVVLLLYTDLRREVTEEYSRHYVQDKLKPLVEKLENLAHPLLRDQDDLDAIENLMEKDSNVVVVNRPIKHAQRIFAIFLPLVLFIALCAMPNGNSGWHEGQIWVMVGVFFLLFTDSILRVLRNKASTKTYKLVFKIIVCVVMLVEVVCYILGAVKWSDSTKRTVLYPLTELIIFTWLGTVILF